MSSPTSITQACCDAWLRKALDIEEPDRPFPWQQQFFARLSQGQIERCLDIPTGLGKTAVMPMWLVARACGATLPRRLVYVVDRRAVVDQATDVARRLRTLVDDDPSLKSALGIKKNRSLPISTLRGQFVDNCEWLEDPASVAIVVGTVDMVGSKLLFEGYGTSRKMRPIHAGLLGIDTLLVLDEAHLVPPFEMLVDDIVRGSDEFGPSEATDRELLPPLHLMSLSATGRTQQHEPFGLTQDDLLPGTVTRKRLDATKRLALRDLGEDEKLEDALARHAWKATGEGREALRCIVFSNSRRIAEASKRAIEKIVRDAAKKKGSPNQIHTELFVGGRRVLEREDAARRLAELGFIAGRKTSLDGPAFLFATSAGEVGIDLDGDHMVCDLVAWERMVQRLGRVNRRGEGDASVIVIREPPPRPSKAEASAMATPAEKRKAKQIQTVAKFEARRERWEAQKRPFEYLPQLDDGTYDASPGALRALKQNADAALLTILDAASTAAPLRPALSRALVDAWSMTSLRGHPGRPEIAPWLRGWLEDDPPQTSVLWRARLPVRRLGPAVTAREIEGFFEAAPPHRSELLETDSYQVEQWASARARAALKALGGARRLGASGRAHDTSLEPDGGALRANDVAAIALSHAGELRGEFRLEEVACQSADAKRRETEQKRLHDAVAGCVFVVDVRLGGLCDGLLDSSSGDAPVSVDDGTPWMSSCDATPGAEGGSVSAPVVPFRVRAVRDGDPVTKDAKWHERFRFADALNDEGVVTRWLVVEKWKDDAATEEDRSAGRPQLLKEHQEWAAIRARDLAARLGLPKTYCRMLEVAGRRHDDGKATKGWQRAFNAPKDGIYAKTRGPLNLALLDGYRHEFGSLPGAARDPQLCALPAALRELALHLIAAHHGFARPSIGVSGCEDAPPSALEQRAHQVALRYAQLQQRWGPWGLSWWEALLRAADQQASRENEAAEVRQPISQRERA